MQANVSVQVDRLDNMVKGHVHFMEIDAQGSDFAVLRGAERLIVEEGVDIIRVEFTPKMLRQAGEDPVEMIHWLYDRGYVCFDVPDKTDSCVSSASDNLSPWHTMADVRPASSSSLPNSWMNHGPTRIEEYVRALESMHFFLLNGDHGAWRDLLCFQGG